MLSEHSLNCYCGRSCAFSKIFSLTSDFWQHSNLPASQTTYTKRGPCASFATTLKQYSQLRWTVACERKTVHHRFPYRNATKIKCPISYINTHFPQKQCTICERDRHLISQLRRKLKLLYMTYNHHEQFVKEAEALIVKSCKVADTCDRRTPSDVFTEDVGASTRHSLRNNYAKNSEGDLKNITFQKESLLFIQKGSWRIQTSNYQNKNLQKRYTRTPWNSRNVAWNKTTKHSRLLIIERGGSYHPRKYCNKTL